MDAAPPPAQNAAPHPGTPNPHWHPHKSHRIEDDGRIHALEGYRIHVEPVRRNLRDARRLCDEIDCDACIHDCQCLRCSGWCLCDNPPEPATYRDRPAPDRSGEVR